MIKIKNKIPALNLGFFTSIMFVVLFFALFCTDAYALAWKWQLQPGKERLLINLNISGEEQSIKRTSPTTVTVNFKFEHDTFDLFDNSPPPAGSLIKSAVLEDNKVIIELNSPAFGFLVSRTGPRDLAIDFYPDRLGARWSENGMLPASQVANIELPVIAKMPEPEPVATETLTTEPLATEQATENPETAPVENQAPTVTTPTTNAPTTNAPTTNAPATNAPATNAPATNAPATNVVGTTTPESAITPSPATPAITPPASPITTAPPAVTPATTNTISQVTPEVPSETLTTTQNTLTPPPSVTAPTPRANLTNSTQTESIDLEQTVSEIDALADEIILPMNNTGGINITPINEPRVTANTISRTPNSETTSNSVIAKINPNGPEAWTTEMGISTVPDPNAVIPVAEQNPTPVVATNTIETPESVENIAENQATTNSTNSTVSEPARPETPVVREIIYHDEEGNVIPPPPDIPALMQEQRKLIREQKMSEAYPILEELKTYKLNEKDREEVLYNYLATLLGPSTENPEAYYEKVVQAANEAMNYNPLSNKIPEALFQLGMINLRVKNLDEAAAYFNLLRQRYPHYSRVPEAFMSLCREYYDAARYAETVNNANIIISNYVDAPEVKPAAILEAKALYKQGHFDRAMTIVDFINKRYPKIHLEDPSYISVSADIMFREKRYADSANSYWLQYNLNPNAEDIQDLLLRIAEAYYLDGKKDSASTVSEEIANKYPDTEAAAISLLRLGENGIYNENLNVEELFALFRLDNPRIPDVYYKRIIAMPSNSITPMAKIRSIAWQLYQGGNYAAMQEAQKFIEEYPNNPASITAEEIILRGFQNEYRTTMEEENFERLLSLWEQFPSVQSHYYPLEPDFRLALARAKLNRGQENEAVELLNEFVKNTDNFEYSIYAYNIILAKLLREQNWADILKLGEEVEKWNLDQATRDQLDYSLALAAQNLDLAQRALTKWQLIADTPRFPSYQRAYANYFLAREAERVQDLQKAYILNLEALNLFTELENNLSEYADRERIRESIASLMDITETNGQYAESLEWIARYEEFVPESSPDYAGLRFREARVYRKMGDLARWKIILDNIITREPDSVFGRMAASELRTQEVARDISRFN